MNKLILYFVIYLLILYGFNTYFTSINIGNINITKSNISVISLIIPFLIFIKWSYCLIFENNVKSNNAISKTIQLLMGLIFISGTLFFILKLTSFYLITKTNVIILLIILLLALLYYIPQTRSLLTTTMIFIKSILGRILNSLLFFSSMIENTNLTTFQKTTIFISILIFIISLLSFFSPKILLPKHKILLYKPVYLQRETNLGTTENINMKHISQDDRNNDATIKNDIQLDINYNYAISCSIYLNPQGGNTSVSYNTFTKLIDFGSNPILYFNSKKQELKLGIHLENNTSKEIIIKLDKPLFYQKWNNIVFNVNGGVLDVFMNGTVVHHEQIVHKYRIEKITTGEDNGLNGGIRNVVFYNKPLKLYQIHYINYFN